MPVVASATLEVTPVLSGAQQKLTEQLTEAAAPAGETAGKATGSKLASGLVKGIAGGTVALVGAVGAGTAAMISAAGATAEYGDQIDKASQKLGVSSTFYQEWDAVLQHSGTSMDSMSATFKKLANASQDASKDQVAAFEAVGLSMEEVKSMSAEDLFSKVISGLQGMEEGTERTAIATQLLGKGAQELGPLMNTSAEDTQAMINRVHELGGVMSEDSVKAAAAYQDSLQDMQTALAGVKNGVLSEVIPVLADFMGMVSDFITETDFTPLTEVLSSVLATISVAAHTAADAVRWLVEEVQTDGTVFNTVWNIMKTAVEGFTGIIKGVVDMVSGILRGDWKAAWNGAKTIVTSALNMIKSICSTVWNSIKNTAKNVWNGIKEAMTEPIQSAKEKIDGILDKIRGFFPISIGNIFSNVKLPHFSVSGGEAPWGFMGQGSMPHIGINWYAKAMDEPYVFVRPTLFGAGEAGDEIMYGRENLLRDIREASGGSTNVYVTVNGAESPEDWAVRFAKEFKLQARTV